MNGFVIYSSDSYTFGNSKFVRYGDPDVEDIDYSVPVLYYMGSKQVNFGVRHAAIIDVNDKLLISGRFDVPGDEQETHTVRVDRVKQVACGGQHVAFIDSEDRIWTVGANFRESQLGVGNARTKVPVMIPSIRNVKQVSCGFSHTAFIDSQGHIWTVGDDYYGQLGHGRIGSMTVKPAAIQNFRGIRQVSCGERHTAFIDSNGCVWTFGNGGNGRLGHGDLLDRSVPTMIEGFMNIKQISCGYNHTALIDTQTRVWTFGHAHKGQLGHEYQFDQLRPKMIQGFQNVERVECGYDCTMFIQTIDL